MKAIVLQSYGSRPELRALPDVLASDNHVRVRVHATSVNPIDWKQASGAYRPILRARFPHFIPGYDIAGVVESLGSKVTKFVRGQRVHGRLFGTHGGANAEFALAEEDALALMPEAMSFSEAAALPLAGVTALQGLRDVLNVRSGERVLIIGASGGVGHFAIQLGKHLGAHVTGLCSTRNLETVRHLQANEVGDYTQPDTWKNWAPFDAILDCVGDKTFGYKKKLAPRGRLASCLPTPRVLLRSLMNGLSSQTIAPVMLKPSGVDLAQLDQLFVAKALKVLIDSEWTPEQLHEAWERSRSGRTVGKLIIRW